MTQLRDWTAEQAVTLFCQAAVQSGLIEEEDVDFSINRLLDLLGMDEPQEAASLVPILDLADILVDYAVRKNLCEDSPEARERFGARLFGLVTPGPQAVRARQHRASVAAPPMRCARRCGVRRALCDGEGAAAVMVSGRWCSAIVGLNTLPVIAAFLIAACAYPTCAIASKVSERLC